MIIALIIFLFFPTDALANNHLGNELYPANYVSGCSSCTYFILDQVGSGNDSSIVFRASGNARGEIGLVGDDSLHFKTVSGTYLTESFSDRMIIMGASAASPGNIGIGNVNPSSLLSVGTNSDCTIDYVGNLICDSSLNAVNVSGNAVITANGQKTSGNGAGYRIRNPTDGTVGYFAADSYLNGGTSYHQIDVQAAQSDGALCMGGGGAGCGITISSTNRVIMIPHTPASSSEACTQGTIVTDANFIYICTATNVYKRTTLSSF